MTEDNERQNRAHNSDFEEGMRSRMEAGIAAGQDPNTAEVFRPQPEKALRHAVTTTRSRWIHRRCPTCAHTFRLGDRVAVAGDGGVMHDMPGLDCTTLEGAGSMADSGLNEEQIQLYQGLIEAWPMQKKLVPKRLSGDHFLLAPPRGNIPRRSCRVCGHTFRAGDLVVICPCHPENPENCMAAVHRDLRNRLHCWDEWAKGPMQEQCLAMT